MNNSQKSEYNPLFGIMKGLAILSVVVGHSMVSTNVETFVNQYHLAVFFFVSGYFFKDKYANNFKLFAIKRIHTIYTPFVLINMTSVLLHNLFNKLYFNDVIYSLSDILMGGGCIIPSE